MVSVSSEQPERASQPRMTLDVVLNLSRYHREHEKYYAQAPLQTAVKLHDASKVLKTLADRWAEVEPLDGQPRGRYVACEDLNEKAAIQSHGVLFMEEEGEPGELTTLKRDLGLIARDQASAGEWLDQAMTSSWETARALLPIRPLADVHGERHRIIANDWQAASLITLVGRLVSRAVELLEQLDFTPAAVREDLRGQRSYVGYLYSASELIDRAADLASEFAVLVHDNERRWRVFRARVATVVDTPSGPQA
jgi:hypothetical protein